MSSVTHLTTQSNQAVSAANGSSTFQTLSFANSNGVSFSTGTQGIYASVAAAGGAQTGISGLSAGTTQMTSGTAVFSNSNGISFGVNGNTVTASYTVPTQSVQPVAISGSNGSFAFSTATFGNLNGLSFYTSNGSVVASYTVPSTAGLISAINVSGGTTSNNLSAITFSNSNGVTFGLNGSVMTATVKTDYLTTARASTDAIGLNTAQSNVTWTVNSSGLSLDARGYAGTGFSGTNISGTVDSVGIRLSVAPGGGGADGYNILAAGTQTANTTGTVVFSNSNGISFGMSNSSIITASYTVPSTAGLLSAINVSGGTTSNNLSAITFNNANGVSFGLNGSTMTASHNGLTTARASNDAVGLNTALTAGPLAWTVNSSGISLNAGSAAGTTSGFGGNLISGSMTHNTAGLNLSLNHPAWLTTAMQSNAATISNINISAGTTSTNASAFTFNNANGITFGLGTGASAGSITASHNGLTTARASTDAIGLNTAQSNVTWTVNSSGLSLDARGYAGTATTFNGTNASASMTLNSAGLRFDLSVGAGGGVTPVASASNGSFSFTTLAFSNANNVTFGTSAGSIITASVAAPGAAAENNWVNLLGANTAGNTTASGSTIGYSGINLTLSGTNGSIVNISAPATSSIVGTGGITISTNGSTISISGNTNYAGTAFNGTNISGTLNSGGVSLSVNAGAAGTYGNWEPFQAGNNTTFSSMGQNSLYLQKILPNNNYSFNNFELRMSGSFVSSTNSQVAAHTINYGLYSLNGASYSSIATSQMYINASYNSNTAMGYTISQGAASYTTTSGGTAIASLMTGFKHLYLPFSTTITAGGKYAFGINISSATTVGTSPMRIALLNQTIINNLTMGKVHATTILASNASYVGDFAMGVGSVTTGVMPSSIGESALTNQVSQARLYLQLD